MLVRRRLIIIALQGAKNRHASSSKPENNEWEKKDQQLVEKLFHDDMCEAIELSKQEFEKEKQTKKDQKAVNNKF